MKRLSLYMRIGCHLCEDIEQQLQPLAQELGFDLDIIDIDEDPELVGRYGTRVPVLEYQSNFICEYFLDERALRDALRD